MALSYSAHKIRNLSGGYILLCTMLVYIIKPVVPFLYYAIYQDFIAEVYCIQKNNPENTCRGKCHLAGQVSKNSEDNRNQPGDSNNNSKENKTRITDYFLKSIQTQVIPASWNIRKTCYNTPLPGDPHVNPVFIPPRQA